MTVDRRQALKLISVAPFVPALCAGAAEPAKTWTPEWDRALLVSSVARQDADFDPQESMLRRDLGTAYNYHSALRGQIVHPTNPSLQYALALLETRDEAHLARAAAVVERVLALQDTDPASKWYGIWGYYLEEPPSKMSPADWNWADFNGATLLMIEARHGKRLAAPLMDKIREGIRHAAASIRRRNVSMLYTNIAVQGTFVTLGAAKALADADLRQYAVDRLHRFAAAVDTSGSFAEYNSPSYANVTIVNLTRMRMLLGGDECVPLIDKIHERAWLHIGKHWHVPTAQLAGPMSRCYSTDIGQPLWIQKALGGRLEFVERAALATVPAAAGAEVGVHDYVCPETVAPLFLESSSPQQHRELFMVHVPEQADIVHARSEPGTGVQGTTWLDRDFCLGTANRADFWVQRRPLLAYWGGRSRPARYVQMRFLKDDYDFSSALFYSVQEKGFVLGLVNFRSPGGDRHITLDPIANGTFEASRLRLCLELVGVPAGARVVTAPSHVAVDLGGALLWFATPAAGFAGRVPTSSVAREKGRLVISVDMIPPGQRQSIRWADVPSACAAFTLAMTGRDTKLADFDRTCRECRFERVDDRHEFQWRTPSGLLALTGRTAVLPVGEHDRAFAASIDGHPVAMTRLSETRLL